MQKIEIILFILLLNTGCSVLINAKRHKNSDIQNQEEPKGREKVKQWNISERNFYISKTEIEVKGLGKKQKYLGSIKFIIPDKYLLSLKTLTGIELARVLITNDTLLINDRFNKKHYFGSSKYFKQFSGVALDFLPLIFGDVVGDNLSDSLLYNFNERDINIEGYKKGVKILYNFNCKRLKSNSTIITNSLNQTEVQILYKKYLEGKDFIIPREIDINDIQKKVFIRIRISKFESPWEGNIELIPGNGYDKCPIQ